MNNNKANIQIAGEWASSFVEDEMTEIMDSDSECTELEVGYSDLDNIDELIVGGDMPGFYRPEVKRILLKKPSLIRRNAMVEMIDDSSDEEEAVIAAAKPVAELRGRGSLATRWCGTYNNPKGEDGEDMIGEEFAAFIMGLPDVKLAIFQKEIGNECGTPHFQIYVETSKRCYTSGMQSMFAPHKLTWLHAKGTKLANYKYCTKEDSRESGPWLIGCTVDDFKNKAGNQGKRSDLDAFAKLCVEEGRINERVLNEMPGYAMAYNKHAKQLLADLKLDESRKKEQEYWVEQLAKRNRGEKIEGQKQRVLELYFGPTGVGKTTEVKLKILGNGLDLCQKDASSKWWGNYNGEKHVLLDEYKGGQTIDQFKAMTNAGSVPIEGKGTELTLMAEALYFTSNCHPSRWWKRNVDEYETWNSPDYRAVVRRFATVYWWKDGIMNPLTDELEYELVILNNPGESDGSVEWKRSWAKWQTFWQWRDAPGREPAGSDNYFTL